MHPHHAAHARRDGLPFEKGDAQRVSPRGARVVDDRNGGAQIGASRSLGKGVLEHHTKQVEALLVCAAALGINRYVRQACVRVVGAPTRSLAGMRLDRCGIPPSAGSRRGSCSGDGNAALGNNVGATSAAGDMNRGMCWRTARRQGGYGLRLAYGVRTTGAIANFIVVITVSGVLQACTIHSKLDATHNEVGKPVAPHSP